MINNRLEKRDFFYEEYLELGTAIKLLNVVADVLEGQNRKADDRYRTLQSECEQMVSILQNYQDEIKMKVVSRFNAVDEQE